MRSESLASRCRRGLPGFAAAFLFIALAGCATTRERSPATGRAFDFSADTVGFTNETRWIYEFDAGGRMSHRARDPAPSYGLRCFVVSRLNRQFHDHATFSPSKAKTDSVELGRRIREVVQRPSRRPSAPEKRIEIAGYADLRAFSLEHESLLKELGGRPWESYLQRGNWRMILPFPRSGQARTAERLLNALTTGRPRILHLSRFPQLTINHAVLAFAGRRTADGFEFAVADPNDPGAPKTLSFDSRTRSFLWPRTPYFSGGRVDVYEVYHRPWN